MNCRLEREYRFEAAHFLPQVPLGHKCKQVHGHSYRITMAVEGPVDDRLGWVIDFSDIDMHVVPLIKLMDHHLLNDIEGLGNPTSELLAIWLFNRVSVSLPHLVSVTVSETPSSACTYAPPREHVV